MSGGGVGVRRARGARWPAKANTSRSGEFTGVVGPGTSSERLLRKRGPFVQGGDMALFTIRIVQQTDPQLIELSRANLAATERMAESLERQADALEAIVEALHAPPDEEQIPTRAAFTVGTPEQE